MKKILIIFAVVITITAIVIRQRPKNSSEEKATKTMMDILCVGDKLPETDEECISFLTHTNIVTQEALRGLYICRRAQGDSERDALIEVMKTYCNVK